MVLLERIVVVVGPLGVSGRRRSIGFGCGGVARCSSVGGSSGSGASTETSKICRGPTSMAPPLKLCASFTQDTRTWAAARVMSRRLNVSREEGLSGVRAMEQLPLVHLMLVVQRMGFVME